MDLCHDWSGPFKKLGNVRFIVGRLNILENEKVSAEGQVITKSLAGSWKATGTRRAQRVSFIWHIERTGAGLDLGFNEEVEELIADGLNNFMKMHPEYLEECLAAA